MSMTLHAYNESTRELIAMDRNFSNSNCAMLLRSLNLPEPFDGSAHVDLDEFEQAITLARLVGGTIADDGMADVRHGNMINCGVRPGYFADAYDQVAEFLVQARALGVDEVYFV